MKKLGLSVSLVIALVLSQQAWADHRYGNSGFNNGRNIGNHFRSNNGRYIRHSNRNFRGAGVNNYHYGRAGGRRGNDFVGVSWGNGFSNNRFYNNRFYNAGFNNRFNRGFNNRRFNNSGFYNAGFGFNSFGPRNRWSNDGFVGGLVVGSLLNTVTQSVVPRETVRYRSAPATSSREIVRVSSRRPVESTLQPKHRLLRDLQGDCFEIVTTVNGDELRSQVDPSLCSF